MSNENKTGLLASLRKDLEQELEQLKKEKEKTKKEIIELTKQELAAVERKNAEKLKELESKIKQIYYWLGGIVLVLLVIFIWNIYLFVKFIK